MGQGSSVSTIWVVTMAFLMFSVGLLMRLVVSMQSTKTRRLEAALRLLDKATRPRKKWRPPPIPPGRFVHYPTKR